jgi:hypothetical protein
MNKSYPGCAVGDGFRVGRKVHLVHITATVLGKGNGMAGPKDLHTVAIFRGKEKREMLRV